MGKDGKKRKIKEGNKGDLMCELLYSKKKWEWKY